VRKSVTVPARGRRERGCSRKKRINYGKGDRQENLLAAAAEHQHKDIYPVKK